jgi:hypothetical protein
MWGKNSGVSPTVVVHISSAMEKKRPYLNKDFGRRIGRQDVTAALALSHCRKTGYGLGAMLQWVEKRTLQNSADGLLR